MFFESMIENLFYFRFYIILRLIAILYYMNMNGFVVVRIELENETEYDEYCRYSRSILFFQIYGNSRYKR